MQKRKSLIIHDSSHVFPSFMIDW